MKGIAYWIFGILGFIVIMFGISLATGMMDVAYIRTVGKAKQNAQREVFEDTQSFVKGKRQEATKLWGEYMKGDETDKKIIMSQVRHQFAEVDLENVFEDQPEMKTFVKNCMLGKHTKLE